MKHLTSFMLYFFMSALLPSASFANQSACTRYENLADLGEISKMNDCNKDPCCKSIKMNGTKYNSYKKKSYPRWNCKFKSGDHWCQKQDVKMIQWNKKQKAKEHDKEERKEKRVSDRNLKQLAPEALPSPGSESNETTSEVGTPEEQ